MNKNKKLYITVITLQTILILALGVFIYFNWYRPYKEEKDFKNDLSNVTLDDISFNSIDNNKIPEIKNDLLNNTSWVNYKDNTIIVFKDGYFVWYLDNELSSDNCMLGEFTYYKGKDAFALLNSSLNVDIDKTEEDSVLILSILSYKENGIETLDNVQTKYLFGYHKNEIMNFVDILSYDEYTFFQLEC